MFRLSKKLSILVSIFLLQTSFLHAEGTRLAEDPSSFNSSATPKLSDNPIMSLSGDRLNAIPAPIPIPNLEFQSGNKMDTVSYDSQTQVETIIPQLSIESDDSVSKTTQPFAGLLPNSPPSSTESVLGSDGRVQITATTDFPWRSIVRLRVKYPNSSSIFGCSGSIVDDFHVLTAGHCIHNAGLGGWAQWVEIYPGQNGATTPYYKSNNTGLRSYTGWTSNQDPEHDWGLITLDRNIGNWTGWMGRRTRANTDPVYTGGLNVSGYPGDKPSGTHWFDFDNGHSATANRHFYFMDTFGGQSGAPVWQLDGGTRFILTIHAYGDGAGTPGVSNGGTRLNTDKFNRLNTWRTSDTAPTDKPDLIDDGNSFAGFSPTTVSAGDSMSAFSDVRNIGTASSGSFHVSYYASTNTTITTGDFFLGQVLVSSITPFDWDNADWSGTVPSGIPAGSYYVGWIIDSGSASNEFDETNNIAHKTSPKLIVTEISPPGSTSLISPSGSISDNTPTYSWNAVTGSTWYYLWVDDSASGVKIKKWYSAATAGCASGIGTCSVTPTIGLASGGGIWHIRTWNSSGNGPWSTGKTFNVSVLMPPGKATLLSPSGNISDNTPTYSWNAVTGSTWYYLWVDDSASGVKIKKWYSAATAGCASGTGTCSVTPVTGLASGGGIWYIRTWNSSGNGSWSTGETFNVSVLMPPPGKATLLSPSGNISDNTPTYSWNAVTGSTWYYLWVDDSASGVKIKKWYSAATAGCASGTGTCSVTPAIGLASGGGIWYIRTWNSSGNGPWSTGKTFNVSVLMPPLGKATLLSPSGNISDNTPTYSWNAVTGSTWYYLWVDDSASGVKIKKWYSAATAGCAGGTGSCSITPTTVLANGSAIWYIQTWNTSGTGLWSNAKSFTVQ